MNGRIGVWVFAACAVSVATIIALGLVPWTSRIDREKVLTSQCVNDLQSLRYSILDYKSNYGIFPPAISNLVSVGVDSRALYCPKSRYEGKPMLFLYRQPDAATNRSDWVLRSPANNYRENGIYISIGITLEGQIRFLSGTNE